ncbi:MAG: suppressor of fused domain protein [Myxococcaceae bacterium]|nr:suppressor of fused domain protein [Myxococcaceae bacterium]
MSNAGAVLRHYSRFWSAPPLERGRFDVFRIVSFGGAVYATCGLSDAVGALELILEAPAAAATEPVVELLAAAARHHLEVDWLGVGHTLDFGRPWLPGSQCTHGLITLPRLDGLDRLEAPAVRVLQLVPITAAEHALKMTDGLDALEERLEKLDWADPNPR